MYLFRLSLHCYCQFNLVIISLRVVFVSFVNYFCRGKPFSQLDLVWETDNQALNLAVSATDAPQTDSLHVFFLFCILFTTYSIRDMYIFDSLCLTFFMFNLLQSLPSQPYSIVGLFFPRALAVFFLYIYIYIIFTQEAVSSSCNLLSHKAQPATDTGHFTFHATTMTKARIL